MHTLLFVLQGPMASAGDGSSKFNRRSTRSEPTKSSIVGIMCSAMGRRREDPIDDLATTMVGVRIDRCSEHPMRDFHTVADVPTADGKSSPRMQTTERYYLTDVTFLVGVESEDVELLRRIEAALDDPVWDPSIGRLCCIPGMPLTIPDGGIRTDTPLLRALSEQPAVEVPGDHRRPPRSAEIVVELAPDAQPPPGASAVHRVSDLPPTDFAGRNFSNATRRVARITVDLPTQENGGTRHVDREDDAQPGER